MLGFTSPKNLLPRCKHTPFDSDCGCHKAQCNHTVETRRRRHVIMINQSRVRRAGETDVGPYETVKAAESDECELRLQSELRSLSGDSSDPGRLTNQPTLGVHTDQSVFSLPVERQFITLPDKPCCFQSPHTHARGSSLHACTGIHVLYLF